jgi:hypothetical protein
LLEYFENNTVQLFNLKEDLSEQKNLALEHPEKVRELLTLLHDWRKDVSARMMSPK